MSNSSSHAWLRCIKTAPTSVAKRKKTVIITQNGKKEEVAQEPQLRGGKKNRVRTQFFLFFFFSFKDTRTGSASCKHINCRTTCPKSPFIFFFYVFFSGVWGRRIGKRRKTRNLEKRGHNTVSSNLRSLNWTEHAWEDRTHTTVISLFHFWLLSFPFFSHENCPTYEVEGFE